MQGYRVGATVAAVVALACAAVAEQPAPGGMVANLERHVGYLASDAMRGRETGGNEIAQAEAYIAAQFERLGLRPMPGRDSYFVDFTLWSAAYDLAATRLVISVGETQHAFEPGTGFRPFDFSDDGEVTAPIVFAGYGITAPELGYDDYEGLDVAGKLVLVLRHEPGENDPQSSFDGLDNTTHAQFATKAQRARENGARGMLLVTDPLHHAESDDLRLGGRLTLEKPSLAAGGADETEGGQGERFVAVHVAREVAEAMLAFAGNDLSGLQRKIDSGSKPASVDLGAVRASVAVRAAGEPVAVTARNVAGFLSGADPRRAGEWIVIGGHHDHVGGYVGDGDTIFNGADDNASGTAGVIELAHAFASAEGRPARSVLFVTFSAEEKGLLGSRALVEQKLLPVERIVFMLNLDMIGRNSQRAVRVFGDGFVQGLRERVERANVSAAVELDFAGPEHAGNSDHHPFYEQDIPFMFFFTGTHEDYHRPGDHIDKLDFDRMARILKVAERVVREIADAERAPRFVHQINWLGVEIRSLESDQGPEQAFITAVAADSRAAAAGIEPGDVVLGLDGEALDDPRTVGRRFRALEPGSRFALTVRRGAAEPRSVELERLRPGFLGVRPEAVDDDVRAQRQIPPGEGVLLATVIPDGPSARAGLQAGDILLQIDGRPVDSVSLGTRMSQIGGGERVEVLVLRDGERLTVPVTLGVRPGRS